MGPRGARAPGPLVGVFGPGRPGEASRAKLHEKLVPKIRRIRRELVGGPENSIFRCWDWTFGRFPVDESGVGWHGKGIYFPETDFGSKSASKMIEKVEMRNEITHVFH